MQQSNQKPYPYQPDEINLRNLINLVVAKKLFIFGLTGFLTLLAIIYVKNLTPTYKAMSSFITPSDSSIINLNKLELTNESKNSVFSNYLAFLSSQEIQRKVFLDGGYLTALNPENEPIDNVVKYADSFLRSIELEEPQTIILTSANEIAVNLLETPYSISMNGSDPKVISRFLNELVVRANYENISAINSVINQKISIRLDEISIERGLLLDQAKIYRLSQIERMKEEDAQKIREINDKIDRVRFKGKESRLNEIVVLTDKAKLAKSLGIIENNFKLISDDVIDSKVAISIGENQQLPQWYLFGEKALIERIELLENRISDDPFIPELVTLKNKLTEVQNNNTLKTLEARQNDDPFITEIVNLDIEQIKLDSAIVDMTGIDSMQIIHLANTTSIEQNKRQIVLLLALILSFIMSIFLVSLMGVMKPDEEHST